MGFEYLRKIPAEEAVLKEMPATQKIRQIKSARDKEIIDYV